MLGARAEKDSQFAALIDDLVKSAAASKATSRSRTTKPSKAEPVAEEYRPSVISYFDILGFKEILSNAGENANKVAEVLNLARRFSEPDEGATVNFGWRSINFSDLIVRAVPIVTEANQKVRLGLIFQELTNIAHIQLNLAFKGVLIRGALTVGQILLKSDLVCRPRNTLA